MTSWGDETYKESIYSLSVTHIVTNVNKHSNLLRQQQQKQQS